MVYNRLCCLWVSFMGFKKSNYWRDGVREVTKETFNKILELASAQLESSIEISDFRISLKKFGEVFAQFPGFVLDESGGKDFNGFSDGYLHERESYKEELREDSLAILKTSEWDIKWIGQGIILKRIIFFHTFVFIFKNEM